MDAAAGFNPTVRLLFPSVIFVFLPSPVSVIPPGRCVNFDGYSPLSTAVAVIGAAAKEDRSPQP
jgi:hypothetical protein